MIVGLGVFMTVYMCVLFNGSVCVLVCVFVYRVMNDVFVCVCVCVNFYVHMCLLVWVCL